MSLGQSLHETLSQQLLVPVMSPKSAEQAIRVVRICQLAGWNVVEFTNRGQGSSREFEKPKPDKPDLVARHGEKQARQKVEDPSFSEIMSAVRGQFPKGSGVILLGGGMTSVAHALAASETGLDGIVSPCGWQGSLASVCTRRGLTYSATFEGSDGLGSLLMNRQGEWDIQKFFPARVLGAEKLKALLGPYAKMRPFIMPTGGLQPNEVSMKPFLQIPQVVALGMGTLITDEILAGKEDATIVENLKAAHELALSFRQK